MARRSSPSITSTTNRARWRCGSHSSTDGGIRKSRSRLIGRKLLMRLGSGARCESCRRFYRRLPHRANSDRLLEAAFRTAHDALYGFTLDAAMEVVMLRVEVTGWLSRPQYQPVPEGRGAVVSSSRHVYLADGWTGVSVFEREMLGAGDTFAGPAIVTQLD